MRSDANEQLALARAHRRTFVTKHIKRRASYWINNLQDQPESNLSCLSDCVGFDQEVFSFTQNHVAKVDKRSRRNQEGSYVPNGNFAFETATGALCT